MCAAGVSRVSGCSVGALLGSLFPMSSQHFLRVPLRNGYGDKLSRYHWSVVGTPGNLAVGNWQISRVCAALDQENLALHFAKSSLEICQKSDLSEILHTAYEGMARAYALAEDSQLAKEYLSKAREQLSKIEVDDKDQVGELLIPGTLVRRPNSNSLFPAHPPGNCQIRRICLGSGAAAGI